MELSYLESKIFGKVCYGFRRNKNGIVEIDPERFKVGCEAGTQLLSLVNGSETTIRILMNRRFSN